METRTITHVKSKVLFGPFGSGGVVEGFAAPGWENVREAFEANFAQNMELGAQFAVYKDGKAVVDLSGKSGVAKEQGYSPDTLQCVFSSGKNVEAIAVAMLCDRGFLSYDDKVCDHWPAFGKHGKEEVTIADVMRHEAGVPFLADPADPSNGAQDASLSMADVSGDYSGLETKLENAVRWVPGIDGVGDTRGRGGMRYYHAFTRGWVVNGIVRRVDPRHRSLAAFVHDEIATPLGIDVHIGLSATEQRQRSIADMQQMPLAYNLAFELLPAMLGFDDTLKGALATFSGHDRKRVWGGPEWIDLKNPSVAVYNTPEYRALEVSSAGVLTNARSLARLNAAVAGGGVVVVAPPAPGDGSSSSTSGGGGTSRSSGDGDGSSTGVRLLSAAGVASMHAKPRAEYDPLAGYTSEFTQGGVAGFSSLSADDPTVHPEDPAAYKGFTGWFGGGGSMSLWDRSRGVAVAYTMSGMTNFLIGGPRTRAIMAEVQRSLDTDGADGDGAH